MEEAITTAHTENRKLAKKLINFCRSRIPGLDAEDISPYHMTTRKCSGNTTQRRKRTRRTCLASGGRWVEKDLFQNVPSSISVAKEDEVLEDSCAVCFEPFTSIKPRFTSENCTHYICFTCYLTMIKNACRDFEMNFLCPLCRAPFENVSLLLKTEEEALAFSES